MSLSRSPPPPPANLKDRIAALQQRSTSPPAQPSTSGGQNGTTTPVGSLRDKIARFEKKGGAPVPRGRFGLAVPPPSDAPSSTRSRELYGNRVPGLGRPHNIPTLAGRHASSTGSAQARKDHGRRIASEPGTDSSPLVSPVTSPRLSPSFDAEDPADSEGTPALSLSPLTPSYTGTSLGQDTVATHFTGASEPPTDEADAAKTDDAPALPDEQSAAPDERGSDGPGAELPPPPSPTGEPISSASTETLQAQQTSDVARSPEELSPESPPVQEADAAVPNGERDTSASDSFASEPQRSPHHALANDAIAEAPEVEAQSEPVSQPHVQPLAPASVEQHSQTLGLASESPSDNIVPEQSLTVSTIALQTDQSLAAAEPAKPAEESASPPAGQDTASESATTDILSASEETAAIPTEPARSLESISTPLAPEPAQKTEQSSPIDSIQDADTTPTASNPTFTSVISAPEAEPAEPEPAKPRQRSIKRAVSATAPQPASAWREPDTTPEAAPRSSFNVVVHRHSTIGPTVTRAANASPPPPPVKHARAATQPAEPPSPGGAGDLAALLADAAFLEERLDLGLGLDSPRKDSFSAPFSNFSTTRSAAASGGDKSHGRTASVHTIKASETLPFPTADASVPPPPPPKGGILGSLRALRGSVYSPSETSTSPSDDWSPARASLTPHAPEVTVTPPMRSVSMYGSSQLLQPGSPPSSDHGHGSSRMSVKSSPKRSIGRATTFAGKIWGKARSRAASIKSFDSQNSEADYENPPRAASPAPSLQPLEFELSTPSLSPSTLTHSDDGQSATRRESWMSSTSSQLSSPGFSEELFNSFPAVPESGAGSVGAPPSPRAKSKADRAATDGKVVNPPDRSSSLGRIFGKSSPVSR